MSYLDNLIAVERSVLDSNLTVGEKALLTRLTQKEKQEVVISDDPFVYFYEDVIEGNIGVDFKNILGQDIYKLATDEATGCISIFKKFHDLKSDHNLYGWIQRAIKFTDHLSIHYIQEVMKVPLVREGDKGIERSAYIQLNKKGIKVQKAGRIMDHLYDKRNTLEHKLISDPARPGFKKFVIPPYSKILNKIKKTYPDALISFRDGYL